MIEKTIRKLSVSRSFTHYGKLIFVAGLVISVSGLRAAFGEPLGMFGVIHGVAVGINLAGLIYIILSEFMGKAHKLQVDLLAENNDILLRQNKELLDDLSKQNVLLAEIKKAHKL